MITQGSLLFEILRWLAVFLYLAIVFSPFLIIRHERFQPTRWWHMVVVHIFSMLIGAGLVFGVYSLPISGTFEQIITHAGNGIFIASILWPPAVFYSVKRLYGSFNKKRVFAGIILAVVQILIIFGFYYWVLLKAMEALFLHLN